MMEQFSNIKSLAEKSVSIVTGAGTGIGKHTALRLGKDRPILLLGRRDQPLKECSVQIGPQAIPVPLDVSDRGQVAEFASSIIQNKISVQRLVHAAGFVRSGALTQSFDDLCSNWDEVIATNLTGAFQMTVALLPALARPGARIVFVSSIAAATGGSAGGSSIYAASKAGLHGLMAGLARDLSPDGVTVNTVAPGFVADTGFTGAWPQSRVSSIVSEVLVGRPGDADEIAALIEFLCGEDAGYITGEIIHQNGGWRVSG